MSEIIRNPTRKNAPTPANRSVCRPASVGRSMASSVQTTSDQSTIDHFPSLTETATNLCIFFTSKGTTNTVDSTAVLLLADHIVGLCVKGAGCPKRHDVSKTALCPWVLTGTGCKPKSFDHVCMLQHSPTPEILPTCFFFLNGQCQRPSCAFSHSPVDLDVLVCPDFGLLSYCESGFECRLTHLRWCPDFSNSGQCKKPKMFIAAPKARHSQAAKGRPFRRTSTFSGAVHHRVQKQQLCSPKRLCQPGVKLRPGNARYERTSRAAAMASASSVKVFRGNNFHGDDLCVHACQADGRIRGSGRDPVTKPRMWSLRSAGPGTQRQSHSLRSNDSKE